MVRLEEQVVTYRHNLYQEAVFICSKRKLENPVDYYERILSRCSSKEDPSDSEISPLSVTRMVSTSSDIVSDRSWLSLARTTSTSSDIVSDQTGHRSRQKSSDLMNGKEEDDPRYSISFRNIEFSERKLSRVKTPVKKKSSFKRQPSQKSV